MKKNQEDRNNIEVGKISQKAIMERGEVQRLGNDTHGIINRIFLVLRPKVRLYHAGKRQLSQARIEMSRTEKNTGIRVPFGVKPRVGAGKGKRAIP
jgi:hypothetical protein